MSPELLTRQPAPREPLQFERYVVAFLDVLNQREPIRALSDMPESPEQREAWIKQVQRSLGVKESIASAVDGNFQRFLNWERTTHYKGPALDRLQRVRHHRLGIQTFGDTVVAFCPIKKVDGGLDADGVFTILCTCSQVMLSALAAGVPLRGGIELGVATMPNDAEIYGPAQLAAYDLESKVAQYPRVVVGDGLIAYLQHLKSAPGRTDQEIYNKALAEVSLSLVGVDEDGYYFVDFLGTGWRQIIQEYDAYPAVMQGMAFAAEQHQQFAGRKDLKLAPRYARLWRYYAMNEPAWREEGGRTPPSQ